MAITWKYVKPLNDANAVKNFLASVHVNLPDALIACLEKFNGGRPSNKVFKSNEGGEYVFNGLFSYSANDPNYIGDFIDKALTSSGFFPIALEASGDLICWNAEKGSFAIYSQEVSQFAAIDESSNSELFNSLKLADSKVSDISQE